MATDFLTDRKVASLKPDVRAFKTADGRGLYLLTQPNGTKAWRLKYRLDGKEKLLAIGTWPDTSLADARTAREDARKLIAKGVDPVAAKHDEKLARAAAEKDSFASVAADYFKANSNAWSANHRRDIDRILNIDLVPQVGHLSMAAVKQGDVQSALDKIQERGALVHAHDVLMYFRCVWKHYNRKRPDALPDPSRRVSLQKPPPEQHHPALQPHEIGAFLRRLANADATALVRIATRLLLLTGLRTSELREATWAEIDTKAKLWRVPADSMKSRKPHLVPLSAQALELLQQLRTISGEGDLLFPNALDPAQPISNNTILFAIYAMGYKGRMSGHGARSTLSTWCHEAGYSSDAIERQLAHAPADSVKAAYLQSEFLPERTRMLRAWADFLDDAERTAKVTPIKATA